MQIDATQEISFVKVDITMVRTSGKRDEESHELLGEDALPLYPSPVFFHVFGLNQRGEITTILGTDKAGTFIEFWGEDIGELKENFRVFEDESKEASRYRWKEMP